MTGEENPVKVAFQQPHKKQQLPILIPITRINTGEQRDIIAIYQCLKSISNVSNTNKIDLNYYLVRKASLVKKLNSYNRGHGNNRAQVRQQCSHTAYYISISIPSTPLTSTIGKTRY